MSVDPFFITLKEKALQSEERLHPKAAFSKEHVRLKGVEEDHRLPYKRDVDRIVYSKAFMRYIDKTQVVYLVNNDHITHRGLHVQLVSNFARGIAEILGLNLDLVEAISLGHDVGHPPFGHEGEGYLSELTLEKGLGAFAHPAQSCRLFSEIEPLNLGFLVLDGFLCHDGGLKERICRPHFKKSVETHFEEIALRKKEPEINLSPASLEGCLVKVCDTISYLGRDIEDAISLKIIERNAIPTTCLGRSNREILTYMAQDLISNSVGKDSIEMSESAFTALCTLRKFNFDFIYRHPKLKVESKKIKESYRLLFHWLLEDFQKNQEESYLFLYFLKNKSEHYLKISNPAEKVVDFIAGMTDSYFVRTLQEIFVPSRITLND